MKKSGLVGVVNYHAMGSIVFGDCKKGAKISNMTNKMYQLARKTTGYKDAGGYSSGSGSHGSFREYVMYALKIPSITIEIGSTPCPIPYVYYPSIWQKNKYVILREANLF